MKTYLLLLLTAIGGASAFVPAATPKSPVDSRCRSNEPWIPATALAMSDNNNSNQKKKGGLDGNMRNKLVTESIAPWRTIRLFLYGAFGSGAFIGGLVNGSGAIAASSSPEFQLQTEVRNTE